MGEGEIYMGRFTKPDLDGGGKDLHGEIYQTRFLDGGGKDLHGEMLHNPPHVNLRIWTYVYIYICIYVYMCIYVYIYVYMYIARVYRCIYV